ncbi:hypothetical protein J437_LFUL002866 [Ladona fulva]|uniref:Suppressor of cytokine signaling 7 n=1 Tax=Ladona fulva TaxID=123851 RepID=A0A8K0JYU1_LADFU|nr:hypothetical protein J437_LFUL002866 [Ladona fulva]
MESPPSGSTWLEAFPSSDDSGLLLTSGSISSSSGEGCNCTLAMELQDSDDDGKSLSHEGSLDYSDGMSCENFNTLKKGPGWPEFYSFENGCDGKLVPIDPPPEFQDSPPLSEVLHTVPSKNILVGQCRQVKPITKVNSVPDRRCIEKFSGKFVASVLAEALSISCKVTWSIHCSQDCHPLECELGKFGQSASPRLCWTPELPLVPRTCPGSRASPASPLSRHSPNVVGHDVPASSDLNAGEIGDVYNVPFDSDVYAVPVDVVRPVERADGGTAAHVVTTCRKTVQPPQRPGRRHLRKRRRHPGGGSRSEADRQGTQTRPPHPLPPGTQTVGKSVRIPSPVPPASPPLDSSNKRHSVPGPGTSPVPPAAATTARCTAGGRTSGSSRKGRSSAETRSAVGEPIHMTLQEVRQYLRNLYSGSGSGLGRGLARGSRHGGREAGSGAKGDAAIETAHHENPTDADGVDSGKPQGKGRQSHAVGNGKVVEGSPSSPMSRGEGNCTRPSSSSSSRHGFSSNLRQTLCSIFRLRRIPASPGRRHARRAVSSSAAATPASPGDGGQVEAADSDCNLPPPPPPPFTGRALPPLPSHSSEEGAGVRVGTSVEVPLSPLSNPEEDSKVEEAEDPLAAIGDEPSMDFASSIEKVKDYGWYWGPISGEAAEKILANEPDGSFIVRDSSDDHYIFSLTFKLNGCVRHVRIEHDQGNFSFGSCTKFKSHTIVDFIENAVEHSRSGRYLFFLHRRPVLGPMRVQLLHPVSRFKQVQSLQHMCRFVILKVVRRDLIQTLPLPRRIIDYLSTPHYYSEQPLEEERSGSSGGGSPGGGEGHAARAMLTSPTPPPPHSPAHLPPHGPS